jgi:hypothetical protein
MLLVVEVITRGCRMKMSVGFWSANMERPFMTSSLYSRLSLSHDIKPSMQKQVMSFRGTVEDHEVSIAGVRVSKSGVRDLLGWRVPLAE